MSVLVAEVSLRTKKRFTRKGTLFAEKRLLVNGESGRPVLGLPPFLSWNKTELTGGGGGGEKAWRWYKKRGQRLFGHLHLRHRRVEAFNGGVRLERGGEGEAGLKLPQGPSLLGHPLLPFKALLRPNVLCPDISRLSRSRWDGRQFTLGIRMHLESVSPLIGFHFTYAFICLETASTWRKHTFTLCHTTRDEDWGTSPLIHTLKFCLSCLASLHKLCLGPLGPQLYVQLYLEPSTCDQDVF